MVEGEEHGTGDREYEMQFKATNVARHGLARPCTYTVRGGRFRVDIGAFYLNGKCFALQSDPAGHGGFKPYLGWTKKMDAVLNSVFEM